MLTNSEALTLFRAVDGNERKIQPPSGEPRATTRSPQHPPETAMPRIHILHENPDWLPPLARALDQRHLPWTDWFLHEGIFDLAAPPPEGVFYNRMSAQSHTRDHRYAAELP